MPDISLGPVNGGSHELRGYLARPSGDGPWPAVVAIHEMWGLDDQLRRQCDRLAAAGYLTFGPDLFSDGGARWCIVATMKALNTGRGKALADIDAARTHLRDAPDSTGKVGVIGFCMGGGFALVTAPRGFDVAAANYGQAPRHAEQALQGSCPVVASYGGRDPLMIGQAKRVERGLEAAGVENDVKIYPGVGHSFLNEEMNGPAVLRPLLKIANVGPKPAAAEDAWARIEAFFAAHLR
jgi:carboxymethylenebutenolidase